MNRSECGDRILHGGSMRRDTKWQHLKVKHAGLWHRLAAVRSWTNMGMYVTHTRIE